MKRLFAFVALLMITVTTVPIAEAKKFGGGKSFGKSHKTAPAPKQQQQNTNTIGKEKGKQTSGKKGLMGGLLGGLLAGGLLAAFFGGAFEGIQFMDILIMGVIAFVIFKIMRAMLASKQGSMNQRQPAYSGADQNTFEPQQKPNVHNFEQTQPLSGGFGTTTDNDVPHNYPPGFDHSAFINGSREHYRKLQGAWNHNELETI